MEIGAGLELMLTCSLCDIVFAFRLRKGLIVAVILIGNITETNYPYFLGFAHLASGLSNGLSGLAAGICIGIVGDAGVRATAQQPKLFVVMILILICMFYLAPCRQPVKQAWWPSSTSPSLVGCPVLTIFLCRPFVLFLSSGVVIAIVAEALALYGLIVALILSGKTSAAGC